MPVTVCIRYKVFNLRLQFPTFLNNWNISNISQIFQSLIIVDCLVGEWGQWSSFNCTDQDKLCGTCVKIRSKEIIRDCQYGGKCDCKREEDDETHLRKCYYDCEMAPWGNWTEWSCKKCNGELSFEKKAYRCRVQRVAKNCSISHLKRIRKEDHDCSCKEQVEEEQKEMAKCGNFMFLSNTLLHWN